MIIKGKSRGNPKQLAAHLLRADTNERIKIIELNSPVDDLAETFRAWQALTDATAGGTKGLYHANISPDAGYAMTPEQWERAADVLAEKLGLDHQPRVIVLHEKQGREHIHVVWQRTDTDNMTIVSDSWNYVRHEEASLALEREFGHELTPGKHAKRDREQQPDFPRAETNHAEWQQAERTGIDPQEREERIQALKAASDSAQAFKAALEEQRYILARGDRGYLIVDENGDHFVLARQLKEKTAAVNTYMAAVPLDTLPALEEAKAQAKQTAPSQPHDLTPPQPTAPETQQPQPEPPKPAEPTKAPEQPAALLTQEDIAAIERAVTDRHAQEAQRLKNLQAAELNQLKAALDREIREKIENRRAMQDAERERFFRRPEEHTDDWIKKFIEVLKNRINPGAAEQQRQERQRQIEEMNTRQRIERETLRDTLKLEREQHIQDLGERHAQQLRELKARADKDLERYIKEEEAARRLMAQEEERRRLREEQMEKDRKRDGPGPPSPTR